jgi:hypothetical protein
MGFTPSSSTQTVNAYLTQSGRRKLLYSSSTESQIKFFSLHDNDVNYQIAKTIDDITLTYNVLTNGFLPDVTGDNDNCIKSISLASNVDNNSYLIYGGELVVLTSTTATPPTGPGGGGPQTPVTGPGGGNPPPTE